MNCSFRVKREAPFDIPAGATEFIDCAVEPTYAGPFEAQLYVYVDDNGAREIALTVKGVAVDSGSTGDDKPPP